MAEPGAEARGRAALPGTQQSKTHDLEREIERLGYLYDEHERLRHCLEKVAELVRLGGTTDGAHHKQWALSQIGLYCGVSLEDEGIEP